jgi:hypothetical protein
MLETAALSMLSACLRSRLPIHAGASYVCDVPMIVAESAQLLGDEIPSDFHEVGRDEK